MAPWKAETVILFEASRNRRRQPDAIYVKTIEADPRNGEVSWGRV
jgi:hypothetical protein